MKCVVALLHRPDTRDRFVQKCLRPSRFSGYSYLFNKGLPKVLDWRWGVVARIVDLLGPMEVPLAGAFRARTYLAAASDVADGDAEEEGHKRGGLSLSY